MLKVLFDNCAPDDLKHEFGEGIEVTEARAEGLGKADNGKLLKEAHERGYDALITTDTGFGKPGHVPEFHLPVVLLRAFPRGVVGGFWHYNSKT